MTNIKRNFLYNFIWSCSQVLLPLVSIPYISRILTPDGVGRVGFIDSFTYYFITIAEFGITVYGIREVAKEKNDPRRLATLVSELMTLHIISTCCMLVLYTISVLILWSRIGDIRLLLASLSFIVVNAFTCEWYFWGTERFRYITLRSLTVRMLGLVSIFILIKRPSDYYIYYCIITGSAIVTSLWNNAILFNEIKFKFKKVNWRKHLKYVWVTYLISLLYSVPLMLDNVFLRLTTTASVVGLYTFSVKIVRLPIALLTDSFLVFFPRIVSLAKENDSRQVQQKLTFNIQYVVILSVPMGIGLSLISYELTSVFFGTKFLPIADDLRILALFPFFKGVSLFLSNPVLIAHHKEKAFFTNLVISTGLFIFMMLLLGYYLGDLGACIAIVSVDFFMVIANFVTVKKHLPSIKVFDLKTFFHAICGSLLFIPFIYIVKLQMNFGLGRLITEIGGCIIIYSLFLFFIARNNFVLVVKNYFAQFFIRKLG